MADLSGKTNTQQTGFSVYLPTKEACEGFKLRRWPSNYSKLKKSDQSGFFTTLFQSLVDTKAPDSDPRFLSGPQFENKPANIGQQIGAQYSFGYYNGEKSKWFNSKNGAEGEKEAAGQPANDGLTNSVVLEVLSNSVPRIKHQKAPNGQNGIITTTYEREGAPLLLGNIHILPNLNEEGIGFDHVHTYGKQDDIVTNILTSIAGLIGGAGDLLDAVSKGTQGLAGEKGRLGPKPITKIDIADTYQSTDKMSITLPFTLFTKNNFIRDVFGPIMLLNVISHPKRTNVRIFEDTIKIYKNIKKVQNPGVTDAELDAQASNLDPEKVENFLNSVIPGFRLFAGAPPSYVNVRHSAGLFYLKNCVITNFSYKYKGPWISTIDNASRDGQNSTNSAKGHIPWWKFWLPKPDILDLEFANVNTYCWPSYAECSITLRSVDPVFADDWSSLLTDMLNTVYTADSGQVTNGIVSVMDANNSTNSFTSPSNPTTLPRT
jgi:hypothetical protein